jgi:2-succinyl-6-hydroxy-2,4-cyclohexadiene-1-carboxylate synthase
MLLHGFTHTGASWSGVLAALGERYRALAPDLRGHGSASERVPVTLEAVIDDLDLAARERFALAGYSMGGRIALHAALAIPDRIERLVLIGASPGIAHADERSARVEADEHLAQEIEGSTIEEFAERWAANPVLVDQPPSVRNEAHADRLRSTPAGLARALRGLGAGSLPSLWERLGELAMPVTLVVGERDQKFGAIALEMSSAIPVVDVRVVAGAGHAVHLEAPGEVAEILTN